MRKAEVSPAALHMACIGTLIEDRFGDRAVRLDSDHWQFRETALLTSKYVAKHYAPFVAIYFEQGDIITLAEEAMSVPLGTVVETPQKRRYRKAKQDAWVNVEGEDRLVSSEELTSGQMRLRVVS